MLINVKVDLILRQQNKTSETGFFFLKLGGEGGRGLNIDYTVKCIFKHNISHLVYITTISMIACSSLDTKARLFYSNYKGTTVNNSCEAT